MGKFDISETITTSREDIKYSDMAQSVPQDVDFSFDEANDEVLAWKPEWLKWKGIYDTNLEYSAVIDRAAVWTIGGGYTADKATTDKLNKIRGIGKDTFTTLMDNQHRVFKIGGDSFAEIVRNKAGKWTNLVPKPPHTIWIIANSRGIITRYLQEIKGKIVNSWKPNEMFHLTNRRLADSIHGVGSAEMLKWELEALEEWKRDQRVLMHRYVKPLTIYHVATDDETELADFRVQVDNAFKKSENLVLPSGTVVKVERVSVPPQSTIDPRPWGKYLERAILLREGMPMIVLGNPDGASEASAKIIYVSWQRVVEAYQLYVEEQVKNQLGVTLKFVKPISLEPELQQDQRKDSSIVGERKSETQPTPPINK